MWNFNLKKETLMLCAAALIVLLLSVLFIEKRLVPHYRLDYSGQKSSFVGAESRYKAGQTVRLVYPKFFIGTDEDYYFYLDGENVYSKYVDHIGFVIKFKMPRHDAVFKMERKNTMIGYSEAPENTSE